MRTERNNIFQNIDWLLILLYILLVGFGWMNIYTTTLTEESTGFFDLSTRSGKQLLWISLSIPLIILILFFNSKFYERFSSILYLISLASLIGVFVLGKNINGAMSWYSFGGMSLQPSEFAKAFTALAVAKFLSDRQYNLNLIKNQIKVFIIIFLPALLITLQPDPGSALIYLAFFFVLNSEGLALNYIILGVITIVLFILTLLFAPSTITLISFVIITLFVYFFAKKDSTTIENPFIGQVYQVTLFQESLTDQEATQITNVRDLYTAV